MFITLANEQTTKTKRFAKTLEKNSLYSQRCSSYHFLLSLTKKNFETDRETKPKNPAKHVRCRIGSVTNGIETKHYFLSKFF